ncbi:SapC family protein [Marinagarivorans algicola]|uniref:SapC family protein n=1 Tax=Marinagarivorans algicola TaxID=1513270 RepID=UPI0006B4FA67|nr:SapC family protein [Marinagarivorans algicola]
MSSYAVLDNVAHAHLKVKSQYGESSGDNINQVLVFPTEFEMLHREYPILFRQSADQKYYAIALLGLDANENLFLKDNDWNARYIPSIRAKGPFALEKKFDQNKQLLDPLVVFDTADSRLDVDSGDNVFLPHGGYTPYFENILKSLNVIHKGAELVDDFFDSLVSFDLLESITIQASTDDGQRYVIPDLYTISRERLANLTADELYKLNQLNLLEHCFLVLSSLNNVSRIIEMKVLNNR